jgi:hypothetical protein
MFHIVRNSAKSGTPSVRAVTEAVRARLPSGWSVRSRAADGGTDSLDLRAPDGRRATLRMMRRRRITPQEVQELARQSADTRPLIVVAPFVSPRARALLAVANASYLDATGNIRVVVSDPAVFLEGRGADRDPGREPRALRSLKGGAAGRVVRALCDFAPPYGVRTLAHCSRTPLGTVSRVVSFLEQEALLTRDDKKTVTAVDWPALIARWVQDYSVTGSNVVHSYLAPRGLSALLPRIGRLRRYAVTGTLAGPGIAPARLAMIYVDDVERAAETLELVPTDAGANVWLLEPYDEVVFERTQSVPFVPAPKRPMIAASAPTQIAADLMTSPGRGPQEAAALIEKMKGNERGWRQKPGA